MTRAKNHSSLKFELEKGSSRLLPNTHILLVLLLIRGRTMLVGENVRLVPIGSQHLEFIMEHFNDVEMR